MSVSVKNLTKIYGRQKAVNNISFAIEVGEIVGFLGPNGAGKSTTMRMLTGYISPTSGTGYILGQDIQSNIKSIKSKIGYLPEHNPLYLDMYVAEYLGFVADIHQLKDRKKSVENVIKITGLERERHKKIGMLSKGYRQRVGLAQALIHDPKVIILDEPTAGLDPNQLVEIRALIKDIGKDKTVLFSSHIMQEVQAICDRVIIINNGEITADRPIDQLTGDAPNLKICKCKFEETGLGALNIPLLKEQYQKDGYYYLTFESKEDVRKLIFSYAVENSLTLLHLEEIQGSLEDAFQKYTQS